jgi:predicted AlkP superfamily phosphohydrolase/phosphomutase
LEVKKIHRKKVLVVGIDGASLQVIEEMRSRGGLPVLSSIMDKGTAGVLTSVVPPLSPPAWSTFLTGANPGKHGVFHFLRRPYETSDEARFDFYSRHTLKAPSIPEIIENSAMQIGMVNVCPPTPPFQLMGL